MAKVLITGATGNVGTEVIKSLQSKNHRLDLYAGVRNLTTDDTKLDNFKIKFAQFDFTDFRWLQCPLFIATTRNFRSRKIF